MERMVTGLGVSRKNTAVVGRWQSSVEVRIAGGSTPYVNMRYVVVTR